MFLSTGLVRMQMAIWVVATIWLVGLVGARPALAQEEEDEGWGGELVAAVTAQSGSVDTFAGTLDAEAERKWTEDLLNIRFTGVYGTTRDRDGLDSQSETIQNSQALFGNWKRHISGRFFWTTGTELSRDTTQDREVRARLATGPGYRVWAGEDQTKSHFDLSAGFGYRYELYDGNNDVNPSIAVDGDDSHLADAIAQFEYKNSLFEDRIDFTHTGSVAMPVNQTSAYIVRTEVIAGIPVTEAWSFRTGVFYEYVNDVPDDQNPSTLRVTVGLGYQF